MRAPALPRPAAGPRGVSVPAVVAFVAVVAAFAMFPQLVRKPYVLHMSVVFFLAVIQGQAWNVIGGYTGQYSVGHAAFFGVGAYTTMMLLELQKIAPWWGIWAAMASGVLLSLVVGSITFRLRGPYFVLASIAVAEILRLATLYFKDFTHGAEGFLVSDVPTLHLLGVELDFITKRSFYYVGLVAAVAVILVNVLVQHSKLGYYFQAIREDQDAAHSLGINLAFYKNVALAISAAFTAFAGGFYAIFVKFIDPGAVFDIGVSVQMVLICIIGGIGTILGPVLGAAVLVPLSEVLRNPRGLAQLGIVSGESPFIGFVERRLSNAHLLVYGILVVVVILFAPDGVVGVLRRVFSRRRRRPERDTKPAGA